MKFVLASLLALSSSTALAADPAAIELFGTTYRVQRFDYHQQLTFTDPLNPTQTIGMIECEGFHWLGNGHFLLSSNEMDQFGSYANFVIEGRVVTDAAGDVTGLAYVRTIVTNDVHLPGFAYDLDPSGITVGPGGALLVADSENEFVRFFDFTTGAPLGGDFATTPQNDEFEDLVVLNGEIFTVREAQPYSLMVFDAAGTFSRAITIAQDLNPAIQSAAKGIAHVADVANAPAVLRGHGDVFLLAIDDNHPGLQAITSSGVELGWFPLTQDGTPNTPSILDSGAQTLQLESVGFDADSGRLFLVQQGSGTFDNVMWVLTPAERSFGDACVGSGGFTPKLDADGILQTGENFQLTIHDALGQSTALLVFGQHEASLAIDGGPCLLNVAPLIGPTLALPLTGFGAGQGEIALGGQMPSGIPALAHLYLQAFVVDTGAPSGFASTQGLALTTF
jgi:hypothetical protein